MNRHCANGDEHFDGQNGPGTNSALVTGLVLILSINVPGTIDTMLNFDGHSDGDITCKQTLNFQMSQSQILIELLWYIHTAPKQTPRSNVFF